MTSFGPFAATASPTASPAASPTASNAPSKAPSKAPTKAPTKAPSAAAPWPVAPLAALPVLGGAAVTTLQRSPGQLARKFAEMLLTALTLVTALAWSDAAKSLFAAGGAFGHLQDYGPWAYACAITAIVFLVSSMASNYVTGQCTTLCPATVAALAPGATAAATTATTTAPESARPRRPAASASSTAAPQPVGDIWW